MGKDAGAILSWYSHGGLASRQMPQGLSVWVRLLLIGPGAGMQVARGGLPSFGALRRDNTPTDACLRASIWGVHRAVQSAPGAVSEVSVVGIWPRIYAGGQMSMQALVAEWHGAA